MNNEVIERYKRYLTNAQVKELAAKAERYKLLNAQSRANAQNSILAQQRQARRGLQNVGLASREGKVISGMETARNDALAKAYDAYNRQLRKVEDAQTQSEAVRMANANLAAQQRAQQEAAQQQAAQQQAQAEAMAAQRERNALRNQVRDRNQWNQQMTDTGDAPRKQPTVYEQAQTYALQQGATKKDAVEFATQYDQAQKAYQQYQNAVADARQANRTALKERQVEERMMSNAHIAAQKTIAQNEERWDAIINKQYDPDKSPTDEKLYAKQQQAIKEKETAYSEYYRTLAAEQYPQYSKYLLMTDDQFNVAYKAQQQRADRLMQMAERERNNAVFSGTDRGANAVQKAQARQRAEKYEREAMEMLAPWDYANHLREITGEAPSLASTVTVPERDKTKDKEYSDMTAYVRENQENWNAVPWASNSEWNGQNWKNAKDKGWSASDYKGKSKYDALINEWAYINGRTALLYTQKFNTVQSLGNFKDLFTDDVTRNSAYHWFRDECMKAFGSMDGNVGRLKEKFGYGAEREQMDAMLTLANLMTDEERARFNGMLETYGAKYADEYFEYLYNDVLPQRFMQYTQGQMAFDTRNASDRLLQSIMSVPTNILQSGQGVKHTMATRQTDPVAAQLGAQKYNMAQTMRGAVGEHYGEVGNFLYQTAMSMADSATVAAISGGIGNMVSGLGVPAAAAGKIGSALGGSILGASAYNSSYQEALQKGLSPEKARLTALGNGVNEMLFEAVSLDLLVGRFKTGDIVKVSEKAWKNWLVNTLIQGGVEGSEEVFTDLANTLWDKQINGIYSDELKKLREYIADGMSYEDAKRKVAAEFNEQLGMSFLGGFVSGGVMGGAAGAMHDFQMRGFEKQGKSLDIGLRSKIDGFQFKDKQMQELQKQSKKTNQDYGVLLQGYLAEKYGQFEGNVQQAVKDGTITNEDAALLDKWQKGEVTADEMQTVNETLAKLDIEPLMEIAQAQQQLQFNQTVGVKNAETLRTFEAKQNEAQKQHEEEVAKIEADETLTDAQKEQKKAEAYQRMTDAKDKAQEELSAKVGKKFDIKVEKDGMTVKTKKGSGNVTFDFSTYNNGKTENHNTVETMTEREKAALRIAQVVAALNGTNIKVESQFTSRKLADGTVEDLSKKNGYYDPETDTIHVNLNGTNSVLWTISHELTHRLATMNKQGYAELHDAIKAELTKEDLTYSEVQTLEHSYQIDKLQEYLNKGMNFWDALVAYEESRGYKGADAEEEVVARCCEQFLAKTTFINSFASKHYKTAKSISAFLTRMNADMQQLFADVNTRSTLAATTRNAEGYYETWNTDVSPEQDILNQVDALDDIARKWENAVKKVEQKRVKAEVRNTAKAETRSETKTKMRAEVHEHRAMPSKSTDIRNFPTISAEDAANIERTAKRQDKRLKEKGFTEENAQHYYDMVTSAVEDSTIGLWRVSEHQEEIAAYAAQYIAENSRSRKMREWVQTKENAKAEGVKASTMDKEDTHSFAMSDKQYMSLAQKVKDGTATDADKAELRKQVDAAAKAAGYGIRAYHGTPNGTFNKFREWQYFTTNKEYADVYQEQGASSISYKKTALNKRTYDTFLKMERPFDTRTARDRKIFNNEFYQKWGNGSQLTDRGLPDWVEGLDLIEFVEDKGYNYDSILLDEGGTGGYGDAVNDRGISYVIKNPSQIKSADLVTYDSDGNIIPLSERFRTDRTGEEAWKNEDIRYSTQDKDFHLTQRIGEQRVYEMRGTTANVYGSSVELEGGSLLNRVRMMQNLAEMYGSVTVTATSEKEAQAFERAGAKRETDTFGDTEYGTWAFEHKEDQYREDTQYDAKQKRNFANAVLKEVGTYRNFKREDLRIIRARLEKAFAILHNAWHGQGDQLVAWEYADRLFDAILNRYTEMSEADAEMRDAILSEIPSRRDAKGHIIHDIEVTSAQMAEIKHVYGSVSAYNQALTKALGTRVYVKEAQNAQTLEDVFANNPYLDATTNEGDMPTVLLDRAQETVGKRTNPYKAESEERAALKEAIVEKAFGIVGIEKSTTQKVREAVKQAKAEERAKVRREERARYEKKLDKIKEVKYSKDEQVKKDLLKVAKTNYQRLVNMLANPTEASHVPVQLARQVSEICLALSDLMDADMGKKADSLYDAAKSKRGVINMDKLIDAYKQTFADKDTIEQATRENPGYDPRGSFLDMSMYDETLVKMMEGVGELLKGKTVKQMDNYELRALMYTLRGVLNTVYDANKATIKGEKRFIYKVAEKMVSELQKAKNVFGKKQNAITRFLNQYTIESLGLRRIAKLYSNSDENAEFVKLVDDLNEGALEMERIKQTLNAMFNNVTQKYEKDMKTWYGKNAQWIDIGNGVKITKGMRVSLAMHILNRQNLRNVEEGGLTIPDADLYKKGKYKEAYKNGTIVRLTKAQAEKIISQMTEAEKAYFEVAKEFFHKRAGYYINRTSLKLLGYMKAIVRNYFPIQTDDAYRTVKYDDVHLNGSVEHPGFLESRKGTANVMYLNDITAVVNRQINGVAKYAGLAIPMRNYNNVMNQRIYEDINGEWRSDKGTVHNVLEKTMGFTNKADENGEQVSMSQYVDQFIQDLTNPNTSNVNDRHVIAAQVANFLTSNYVKAVLTLNARVALSQVASLPTAAAEIPWKYIGQSFFGNVEGHLNRNESNELIDTYTPIFAMRRAGTQTEVSEIMKRKGLADKAEQKVPWALGWITFMDTLATRRLWYACERWVKGETKIPVGSDAFYKEVAKRYERVIQNTQPNFTVLQRSSVLRSKNPGARIFAMFGTQLMQNEGILIEKAFEFAQAEKGAQKKAALKGFGRALSAVLTSSIVIGLEHALVNALRGRTKPMQDDEEKKVTFDSVRKYIDGEIRSSIFGSFLYVGAIYDVVNSVIEGWSDGDYGYDDSYTLPVTEALSAIVKFFKKQQWQYFGDIGNPELSDHQKWLKTKTFVNNLLTTVSYLTGLPLANASKTILNGVVPAVQDHIDMFKTGEFPQWWLHQSGRLDSDNSHANYTEWTNDGKKGSVYLYWENVAKNLPKEKDTGYPKAEQLASRLMADRDLTPEEKATLYRMLGGDLVQEGSVVYHPLTVNQKYLKDKEHGTIAADFTNYSRYQMSQMDDAKYNGFLKAVEMGVPEDLAATAFRNYASAKKNETRRGVDAKDSFHEWLFKMVSDPAQRAILDMQVVGSAKSVKGSIGYKENGDVYADYSSRDSFNAYTQGTKKTEKAEAVSNLEGTPQQKAEAFASMYGYTAKNGIVYNDKGVVQADYTSDEAYKASQMDESHYKHYTDAVKGGMSRGNAIKAVEMHKQIDTDGGDDDAKRYREWVFKTFTSANDRAVAESLYITKELTIKDGRSYDENGYIYRDYTSVAWYKLSNRTLSKDGKNKRYETAQTLTKQGYTAEQVVATYVELDKLSKKTEWKQYLKDHGFTDEQINLFLWSNGWAKLN